MLVNIIIGGAADEILTGSDAPDIRDVILGDAGDDVIIAGDGHDILSGGSGADTLRGGRGHDLYLIDPTAPDEVAENFDEGIDTVFLGLAATRLSYSAATAVENIIANPLSSGVILVGNEAGNGLVATLSDDRLRGEDGADQLYGLAGDDVLVGGRGGDYMDGGDGFDTVSYSTAGEGVLVDLQNWALNTGDAYYDGFIAIEAVQATDFADSLRGDTGANAFNGGGGVDFIDGRAGGDVLSGEDGNDFLVGGLGLDTLTGGAGADTFHYRRAFESDHREVIRDFTSGEDVVSLETAGFGGLDRGALDGSRLVLGVSPTEAFGQFLYNGGVLWWDRDGTGPDGAVSIVSLEGAPPLTASDILIV